MRSIWSDGYGVIFPLPVTVESLICLSVCLSGQRIQWHSNTHSTSGIHTKLSNTISTFLPLLLSDSRLIPTCHITCRDIYPLYKQHVTCMSVIKILPFLQFALCVLLIVRQRQKRRATGAARQQENEEKDLLHGRKRDVYRALTGFWHFVFSSRMPSLSIKTGNLIQ